MIVGSVTPFLQPTIRLTLQPPSGAPQIVEPLVDTGFTGFLSLPASLLLLLGFPWLSRQRSVLADGREEWFDVYEVTLLWDSQVRTVETDAADQFSLVGMALLVGYDLFVRVAVGGAVTIEASP